MGGSFQKILTKKMTRRQFLTYLGVIGLTVLGISSFLKSLKSISSLNLTKNTKQVKKVVEKNCPINSLHGNFTIYWYIFNI